MLFGFDIALVGGVEASAACFPCYPALLVVDVSLQHPLMLPCVHAPTCNLH
jgi:hypothetical protein